MAFPNLRTFKYPLCSNQIRDNHRVLLIHFINLKCHCMTYLEKATALQEMIAQGQSAAALDQFYHPDVRVIEPVGDVREGIEAQRKALTDWASSIGQMHGGGCTAITANEAAGITTAETWVDVTFKEGGRMKLEEVAVQKWKGEHIIEERFYYNAPNT